MLPRAYIVHQLRGRLRLRIREKRQDPDFFQEICVRLESLPGVVDVRCNANTGSLLLLHPEQSYVELEPQLQGLGLFELVSGSEPTSSMLEPMFEGFSWADQALNETSTGKVDLRSLAFIGLMGLAVQQIYRGNIVGPAIPMLISALDLAQQSTQSATTASPDADE